MTHDGNAGRKRVFSTSSASRNPRNIPDIPPVSLLDLAKNPSFSARRHFCHGLLEGDISRIRRFRGSASPVDLPILGRW